MVCGACKSEVKDGAKFCPVCGTAMEATVIADQTVAASGAVAETNGYVPFEQPFDSFDETQAAPVVAKEEKPVKEKAPKKKMSKGKKALIIICCILVVLIGGAVAAVVSVFNSPAKKVADMLDDKNFIKAADIYESKIKNDFFQEMLLEKFIAGYSDEIYNGFMADGISASEAVEALETVKGMNVFDVGDISLKIKNVNSIQISKDAYENANKLFENGDYINASKEYEKVIELDASYADAQKKIAECGKKYKEFILNQVGTPSTDSEYEDAISVLENAAQTSDDKEIDEKLNGVKSAYAKSLKDRAFSESVVLLEQKKYEDAFAVINKAATYNPGDADIASLISSVTVEYEKYVIGEADAHLAKYEYDSALEVVDGGLAVLPQSKALSDKKTAIEAAIPVSLSKELMINNNGWAWNEGDPIDSFGNVISGVTNYAIFGAVHESESAYGEFRVYGKYSKLSGKITPCKNIQETEECYIYVYADDVLVYNSPKVGRKTDTVVFSIDIKNADYIKIVVFYPKRGYWDDIRYRDALILSDLMLHS